MKRKSNKKLTIALLALLGVVSTAGTYAYWQGAVLAPADKVQSNEITIGKGADVATVITLNSPTISDKKLVPTGFADTPGNQVEKIEYTYEVTWLPSGSTKVDEGAEGTGTLTVASVVSLVGVVGEPSADQTAAIDLVNVAFDKASYTVSFIAGVATKADVKVTVTLGEPGTAAIYDAIAEAAINIQLTFKVEVTANVAPTPAP